MDKPQEHTTSAEGAERQLHLTDNAGPRVTVSLTSDELLTILAGVNMARCTREQQVGEAMHMYDHFKIFSNELNPRGLKSLLMMLCGAHQTLGTEDTACLVPDEEQPVSMADLLKAAGFHVIDLSQMMKQKKENPNDNL